MTYEPDAKQKGYMATEDGKIFGPSGKELKLTNKAGYLYFHVRVDGVARSIAVHRYVPYYLSGDWAITHPCVRHLDNDKSNNHILNLSPGSLSDNYQDNSEVWKLAFATAGAHTRRKLTDDQVVEIKSKLAHGFSVARLCKEYNVANGTIQQIKEGKSYKWIK